MPRWYLSSLLILLVLVGGGFLTGNLLIVWLPARMQPAARVFLSVPLGWALLTLVATLLGWAGHGYADCHPAAVTAALAAAGAWAGRRSLRRAGGDCLRLAGFCVVASFPVLAPLLRIGTFNLYNDTYLYDGQARWLQHHGFLATAHTDGGHPLWGTVILMQRVPLRMGASFVLGWVEAIFGSAWPHDVFPAVAALGVVCGALAVGATLLAACPGRWPEAWLTALAVAVTVNGFAFGATNGFLPQTWGLALAAAAFGLRGLEMSTHAKRSGPRARWRTGLPLGICAAASMHCYWDVLPLEAPALACSYLLPWPGRSASAWRGVWTRAWVPLLTCVLLVNLEWERAVRGILYNMHALAANPVAWPAWHFPAHALGFKSSAWERERWITSDLPWRLCLGGCAAVAVWLALMALSQRRTHGRHWRRPPGRLARWRWQPLMPALAWTALSVLLFVYFRYAVPSPWHGQRQGVWADGTGQSWSQYKLTTWASFAVIGLVAALAGGVAMRTRSRVGHAVLLAVLALWCGSGLGWNGRIALWRGDRMLEETGTIDDPFSVCLAMQRKAALVPPGDWIYLAWPPDGRGDKLREVMVCLLYDHPLASNWTTGVSIAPYVTPADLQRTPANCQWVLRYQALGPGTATPANVPVPPGGMTLEPVKN